MLIMVTVVTGGTASERSLQPTHETILSLRAARIVELFDQSGPAAGPTGERWSEWTTGSRVAFSVEFDASPSCGPDANPSYLFLIDSDRSVATGGRTQAVPELGVEFKVEIRCDAASRRFVSSLGAVDVRAGAGDSPTILEVIAPANVLPSERFHWVALAHNGSRFVRLPDAGRFAAWRPVRQWLK
jgi:hypothetical protein